MRNNRSKLTALVGIWFAATIASAHGEVAVGSGRSVPLMTMSSVDQGCHSLGPVTINVLEAPRGGSIEISQTRAYPNFNALNTRSRCNTLKLLATRVIYHSDGSFLGMDSVTVEAIFPEGMVRRIRVPISVRPIAPGVEPPPLPVPEASAGSTEPEHRQTAKPKAVTHHARHLPCHDCGKMDTRATTAKPTAKPQQANPLMTPI